MVVTRIHCKAEVGQTIHDFAKELVELKRSHPDIVIEGVFDDVPIIVYANTTEEEAVSNIVDAYYSYLPNFLNKE